MGTEARDRAMVHVGDKVRYSPIIGGADDGGVYTVRRVGSLPSGTAVAWLNGKAGCVSLLALSPAEVEGSDA